MLPIHRLEQYSLRFPQEVLFLTVEDRGERDEILVFKGFSSSLINFTDSDPDIPILPETAVILSIDRLFSPYNPNSPNYLEKGLTWERMLERLNDFNL
ncbi:MAG: hypothetical protein DCF12_01470 [Snowella sp.]|nr:MAG: hypothetical protein DCF12_01470 [Snowella sp.]